MLTTTIAARAHSFVTICAKQGKCVFGEVCGGVILRSPVGEIACACWFEAPSHFSYVELDAFIVMPNHVHGLLWLHPLATSDGRTDERIAAETNSLTSGLKGSAARRFGEPLKGSVSTVVSTYKAAVTCQARRMGVWSAEGLWHGRFWDPIVRNNEELNNIRNYIADNPNRWAVDQLHPDAPPNRFTHWSDD